MVDFPSEPPGPRRAAAEPTGPGPGEPAEADPAVAVIDDEIDHALEHWLGRVSPPRRSDDPSAAPLDPEHADELAAHARARVRDLLLAGASHEAAVAAAIAELGRADDLAVRLRAARTFPRRRRIMQLFTATLGAGLLGVGVLVGTAGLPGLGPGPRQATYAASSDTPAVGEGTVLAATDEPPATLEDVAGLLARQLDRPVHVHWPRLQAYGVGRGTDVVLPPAGMPMPRVLASLADQVTAAGGAPVAWHEQDGVLELMLRVDLDRRTTELVVYDLGPILDGLAAGAEPRPVQPHESFRLRREYTDRITNLLTTMTSADDWARNGGDLASVDVVGPRMFVSAPSRIHEQVTWMLGQLLVDPPAAAGDEPGRAAGGDPGDPAAPAAGAVGPGEFVTLKIRDLLQPGGWIEIRRRVDAEGRVGIPVLGPVEVAGLDPAGVEQAVMRALVEQEILGDPVVVALGRGETLSTGQD